MRVKLNKAAASIFGRSALEGVYIKAIANSLDANADRINIIISAENYNKPNTLTIEIIDNGEGFTDERFAKFINLFDAEDINHKGLGRLIYLVYFKKTQVSSNYNELYTRTFEFSNDFKEKSNVMINEQGTDSGTKLTMSGYTFEKLRQNSYIQPSYLKTKILEEFYSRLFKLKLKGKQIEISISATIDNITNNEKIKANEIPDFKLITIERDEHKLDLISKIELYYSIEETQEASISITAISVDDRTYPIDVIAEENFPSGYKLVFLMFSEYFGGKVSAERKDFNLPNNEIDQIKRLFRNNIARIIEKEIPQITKRNQNIEQCLVDQYPHLNGYFDSDCIGYTSRDKLLEQAQDEFFKAQRKILDAETLTPEQYNESLELSARALAEYILFRQSIIKKLKDTDNNNSEFDIHNLIMPRHKQFDKADFDKNLYRNNVWLFDDKYMTYDTILSEKDMCEVIKVITKDEYAEGNSDRPDIAMFFSSNPNKENDDGKVDVVIVELKKKGITLEENIKVVTQLEKRARDLMKYYKNKIQRIWFYGVIEFNEDVEEHLSGEYKELYSTGKMYYRETTVAVKNDSLIEPYIRLPIGVFIMDYGALVNDADARNATFLSIIRNKFGKNKALRAYP
jgi:hypothetical protein